MQVLRSLMLFAGGTAAVACSGAPIVIAHRGASGYLPEHTLPAKAMAYAMGADFIEQDVVLSRDGIPVVLHDITLDTVTDVARQHPERKRSDGRYYVLDFTVEELKQLRVSERFNLETGRRVYPHRFPAGGASFQISTLEEELELISGLNATTGRRVGIYTEIKSPRWHRDSGHDISRIVLAVIARHGYRSKSDAAWLQCFDGEEVKRLRHELGWSGNLVLLLEPGPSGPSHPPLVESPRPDDFAEWAKTVDGIGPPISSIVTWNTPSERRISRLVEDAHAVGLAVHPYTVRIDALPEHCPSVEELHAALFTAARVDGVFTDFPDLSVRWRDEHRLSGSSDQRP